MQKDLRLEGLVNRYLAERVARHELLPKTARAHRYVLLDLIHTLPKDATAKQLTRARIERFLAGLHVGKATLRLRVQQIHSFCAWLVVNRYITVDPSVGVSKPKTVRPVPRALNRDSIGDLLEHLETHEDTRWLVSALLMVQEGLRCIEVSRLMLSDVNMNDRLICVRGKGGDGEVTRILPISDETFAALLRLEHECPPPGRGDWPLLRSLVDEGAPISAQYISNKLSRIMHSVGINDSPHALRHTAATDMLRGGAHLRDVQRALGHATLTTTETYLPWLVNLKGGLRDAMGGRSYRGVGGNADESVAS